jgi:diguanylate cyclase (GGDEF)-like protein
MDADAEINALIVTFLETERRLDELTAGELDAVADGEGRTFLLRRAQTQMRQMEAAKQAAVLNALPAYIALLDRQGVIISVNDAWRNFGGPCATHDPGHPVGSNYIAFCDAAPRGHSPDSGDVAAGIRAVLEGSEPGYWMEYGHHAPERWFRLSVTPLGAGPPGGAVVMHTDISAQRRAKEELQRLASQMTHWAEHDYLTGLANRIVLKDRVEQAIVVASRRQKSLAVLFLDLDGFKHVNDSLGHPTGDKVLQSVGRRLVSCVRPSDTVSRQGGDEFVMLLSELDHPRDAATCAGRILRALGEPHSIDGHDLYTAASIGVSLYPEDGQDAETLIKNADTAMYHAKENGRQSYQFFKPAMNVRAVERHSMEDGLRRALERGEFTLNYQPKVDLATGGITGAEALLRWTHPIRGAISPADFIPVAEDCGLIVAIGSWVLREACGQMRAWLDAGLPDITIAVNVSAMEFQREAFLDGVLDALRDSRLDPRRLELELTEGVFMKRVDSTASILRTLRESGVRVSLDDFGTGYSSLNYLRRFPVDALKIDQSFVRQIGAVGEDRALVVAMIGLAKSLNLRVIAEGVETAGQLAFLREHRCDEAQGYYFGRPTSPARFASLLSGGLSVAVDAPAAAIG